MNVMWFLSFKGRKSDANNAAAKVLTPLQPIANENNQTSGGKRKRMANKKLFDSDYITDESEAVTGKIFFGARGLWGGCVGLLLQLK